MRTKLHKMARPAKILKMRNFDYFLDYLFLRGFSYGLTTTHHIYLASLLETCGNNEHSLFMRFH